MTELESSWPITSHGIKHWEPDGTQRYAHVEDGVTTHWIKRPNGEWSKSAMDIYGLPGPLQVDVSRVIWSV